MNPADPQHSWSRLTAAARTAPDRRETAAPYGFATRVAALALAAERPSGSLFERFSLRALGLACAFALLMVATNYTSIARTLSDGELGAVDDPVSEILEIVAS